MADPKVHIERAKQEHKKIKQVVEDVGKFCKEFKHVSGVDLTPTKLLGVYTKFLTAVETGIEIAEVAEEVRQSVRAHYVAFVQGLRGQRGDFFAADQAAVEEAAYARQWQARAVNYTLNLKNDQSVISRLTKRWKDKLIEQFESAAVKKVAEGIFKRFEPSLNKIASGEAGDLIKKSLKQQVEEGVKAFVELFKRSSKAKKTPTEERLQERAMSRECLEKIAIPSVSRTDDELAKMFPECY